MKKSKIAQNSLPVPCSQLRVPLPQRQFLTPTYLLWGKDTFLIWHLTGGTEGGLHITDVTNPPSAS